MNRPQHWRDLRLPEKDETCLSAQEVQIGLRDATIPPGYIACRVAYGEGYAAIERRAQQSTAEAA